MITLITSIIAISVFVIGLFSIPWLVHISMTKSYGSNSGIGNYRKFKKHFHTIEWEYQEQFKKSLFSHRTNSEFHAGIIKINGNGMIISNPISHLLVRLYVKKHIEENYNPNIKVEW